MLDEAGMDVKLRLLWSENIFLEIPARFRRTDYNLKGMEEVMILCTRKVPAKDTTGHLLG